MDVGLNWVTQGVIVAIAAAAALRVIRGSRAQARYAVVWAAYLLILALPAVPPALAIVFHAPTAGLLASVAGPIVRMPSDWWTSPAVANGLWIVWSCVHSIRLTVAAVVVHDARRRGRECPASVRARLTGPA